MSLQTYPGSSLNKFSQTVKDYLEKGKPTKGGLAKYRLLNGTKSLDPEEKGKMIFPASTKIPLNGSVNDPGEKQADGTFVGGDIVPFGIVKSYDEKRNSFVFRTFHFQPQKGDGGIFMIRQNVASEMEIYEGLELSNLNGSNPFRDITEPILFERVNDAAEAEKRSTKRNYLKDAYNAIDSWEPDELRYAAAGFNINTEQEPSVLKDRLEELAEKDPKKFYEAIDSPDMKIKAVIKLATQAGIISYSGVENKYTLTESEQTLATLDRKEGANHVDQFCEFIKSSANGAAVRAQLEKLLKANNKKPNR